MSRPSAPSRPPTSRSQEAGEAAGAVRGEAPTHLIIGRVAAPWGHRGEVRVKVETDFPERFADLRTVYVGADLKPYRVEGARLHKGDVVLKLAGVDDPDQAAALRGDLLYVPVSEAVPLGKDEYYHYQILGLDVYTTLGEHLGQVSEILETGGNDVYVVSGIGREVLIPALAHVVQEVDLEHHRLVVTLPPGLLGEEEA